MTTISEHKNNSSAAQCPDLSDIAASRTGAAPSPTGCHMPEPRGSVFRRILVAVDRSKEALWAIDLAAALAAELSSRIGLVHVLTPPAVSPTPEAMYSGPLLEDAMREEGTALLRELSRRCPPAVAPEVFLTHGQAADEIIATATRWRADLIVIGTHGRGPVVRLFLGSTAQAVLRHAPCPVLTTALPMHQVDRASQARQDQQSGALAENSQP